MPISEQQQKILAFPYSHRYQALICDGAVRSGKTSIMTIAFVDWAMREFNNTNFAICGKTVGSAIKNIIVPYMILTYHRDKYKINFTRSDNKMIVQYGSKTNIFYVYGGKDESSYMLIQGITLAGVLLDEVALMTRSFVEEALARCLSFQNRKYWFNCNPDSPGHWFYQEWILQPERHKALHLHFLMTDNPALSAETIAQAEQDFSGVFYDRKVRGLWVVAEGLIYTCFDPKLHVTKNEDRPYDKYYISCDYGTVNAFSCGLWGLYKHQWYRVSEYYFDSRKEKRQQTDAEYYEQLIRLAGDRKITAVIVDPSAASFIETIRRGRRFRVEPASNAVLDGIRDVSTQLKKGDIFINECCTDCIREFSLYRWDEKSGTDKPLKTNDHAMDDMRYFVHTAFAPSRFSF